MFYGLKPTKSIQNHEPFINIWGLWLVFIASFQLGEKLGFEPCVTFLLSFNKKEYNMF